MAYDEATVFYGNSQVYSFDLSPTIAEAVGISVLNGMNDSHVFTDVLLLHFVTGKESFTENI